MRSAPLDAETLEGCIAAAVAAPSFFNTQPWRFRLDPDTVAFEVRAAPERSLRHADPAGRALHLSVGASVFNLRVAVSYFGWSPVVRLLPRPEDPGLLATVRPTGSRGRHTTEHRADLYPAIWRRHSSRFPFSGMPLPPQALAELAEAAHTEGASLTFPAAAETVRLLRVTTEAEQRNRTDTDRGRESRRWVHRDPDDPNDAGLPRTALGPQDARERIPMRDFTAERHPERLSAQDFETAPVIALLRTGHDRRTDWLRAGEALEHVLLVATALGLRASLLHQPMEWPDLRRYLSPDPDHTGHPQMLIRLGYGPEGPGTPRRAPHEVLDADQDAEVPNR
jgi:nitroreductase